MKLRSSLRHLKLRHRANLVVRRRRKVFVVNKLNPKFKARQR
ncbi:putative 50S ribosomal subunit protein L36 [Candidatus Hodgkinia cicadicola Dsem]|nr:putative 50S ribosomal subunit protein L36 [Candidatus Hodgkinia cicadicola Dsem]